LTPSAPWVLLRPGGLGCLARERSAGRGDAFAVCFGQGHDNDPSAGSPTETLLRLLLPLNDKVQWTSRDVGGGEQALDWDDEIVAGACVAGKKEVPA